MQETNVHERLKALKGMERAWTEDEAKEVVAAFEESRHTARLFCKEHDISEQRFHFWKTKLKKKAAGYVAPAVRQNQQRFVAVRMTTNASPARGGMEVVLGNGRTLRIPEGYDPAELLRLVAALEQ